MSHILIKIVWSVKANNNCSLFECKTGYSSKLALKVKYLRVKMVHRQTFVAVFLLLSLSSGKWKYFILACEQKQNRRHQERASIWQLIYRRYLVQIETSVRSQMQQNEICPLCFVCPSYSCHIMRILLPWKKKKLKKYADFTHVMSISGCNAFIYYSLLWSCIRELFAFNAVFVFVSVAPGTRCTQTRHTKARQS